jgi:hypothetical protein
MKPHPGAQNPNQPQMRGPMGPQSGPNMGGPQAHNPGPPYIKEESNENPAKPSMDHGSDDESNGQKAELTPPGGDETNYQGVPTQNIDVPIKLPEDS